VRDGAVVAVEPGRAHVGRGALKLAGALDAFAVDPRGRVAIDIGASTGGFTETLLARGAARVYAVDVGRGQLHESLRGDPRVVVLERTNARNLSADRLPERCSLAVVDVSFISVRKILPALVSVLGKGAEALVLVKPQFEVGRSQVGRGGIVKDPALHLQALLEVAAAAHSAGYGARGACPSPLPGTEGNREFFLRLVPGESPLAQGELEAVLRKAVEP
jgi:23S rRNA (cytidine1920-2'-O)/16S rRNA (cytidine1409-2'-O)-methyltransferase